MKVEICDRTLRFCFVNNDDVQLQFLGNHKVKPDIYIGFSPALDLQCVQCVTVQLLHHQLDANFHSYK
jgi:hypothetical protein